jgi:hypothetical protein
MARSQGLFTSETKHHIVFVKIEAGIKRASEQKIFFVVQLAAKKSENSKAAEL